jgi:hypothetical protein
MNDVVPHFFVSYSHVPGKKDDPYLKRFIKDLRKTVWNLVGGDPDKVGFRDVDNLKKGDDWKTGISVNARRSHSLVCIYTARFFDPKREHEYCGKEFAVFLKRNGQARYHRDDSGGQFRDVRNIFPVLWIGEPDLQAIKLPPYAVSAVHYTSDDPDYVANGLEWLLKKKRGAYHDIVLQLSRLIRDSTAPPLPPLEEEIDIEEMYNAFWEPPDGAAAEAAEAAPETADDDAAGPMHLLAFEIRILSADAPVWVPYKAPPGKDQPNKDQPNFETLVGDVASSPENKFEYTIQTIDPTAEGFAGEVTNKLADATKKQIIPILFVHPECLGNEKSRAAVKEILQDKWRGGLVIPLDESDAKAVSLVKDHWGELEDALNKEEPAVMRIATGGAAEFQTAAASVAQRVLALIQKNGKVEQIHPNPEGPPALPTFTNTLKPNGGGNG